MHDSSTCPVCRGLPVDGSMTDDEFAAFLDSCCHEMGRKQSAFQDRVRTARAYHYDMDAGTLKVGEMTFGMTPIGTHSPEYQTWLWAWANEDFPERARGAARAIRGLFDATRFRVFVDPGIPASAEDAQHFVAMAVHQLGAIGMYRVPMEGGPTLYLAVHEAGA